MGDKIFAVGYDERCGCFDCLCGTLYPIVESKEEAVKLKGDCKGFYAGCQLSTYRRSRDRIGSAITPFFQGCMNS